ncbi:hypothetical protein IPF89_01900 [Candidatus Saccharibacteria bacterium]|nr:MAG: hypothetical protein IPF89_01900 [Candidatus Saccharibacteria bacterium]
MLSWVENYLQKCYKYKRIDLSQRGGEPRACSNRHFGRDPDLDQRSQLRQSHLAASSAAPSLYVVHLPDDRARDLRLSVRPWLTRQPVCLWLVRSGQPHDILPVADARSGRGGLDWPNSLALVIALTSITLWFAMSSALMALVCILVADTIGITLSLIKTWRDPSSEPLMMWGLAQ